MILCLPELKNERDLFVMVLSKAVLKKIISVTITAIYQAHFEIYDRHHNHYVFQHVHARR